MANALFNKGREGFALGQVAWVADDIRVLCVDAQDYTVDLAAHDFLNDIAAGARIATSASLTGKSATDGVCKADSAVFTGVTGDPFEMFIVYKHTGVETTSRLLAYIDTLATGAVSITPNTGNITLAWNAAGIFTL